MNRKILGVVLVSAVALGSGAALARVGAGMGGHGDRGFSMIDTNSDGVISKAEFAVARDKMFQRLDVNSDGYFTREEATAGAEALRQKAAEAGKEISPERAAKFKERAEKRFDSLDTDKDGRISKAEFDAAGDKLFARLDVNSDGQIAKGEGRKAKSKSGDAKPARQ